jgi:hypothetical protein
MMIVKSGLTREELDRWLAHYESIQVRVGTIARGDNSFDLVLLLGEVAA